MIPRETAAHQMRPGTHAGPAAARTRHIAARTERTALCGAAVGPPADDTATGTVGARDFPDHHADDAPPYAACLDAYHWQRGATDRTSTVPTTADTPGRTQPRDRIRPLNRRRRRAPDRGPPGPGGRRRGVFAAVASPATADTPLGRVPNAGPADPPGPNPPPKLSAQTPTRPPSSTRLSPPSACARVIAIASSPRPRACRTGAASSTADHRPVIPAIRVVIDTIRTTPPATTPH
ncbi:hypothetical protein ACWGR4_40790 [Embleya sp. NPDC055664]